jgi:hypothetical protein
LKIQDVAFGRKLEWNKKYESDYVIWKSEKIDTYIYKNEFCLENARICYNFHQCIGGDADQKLYPSTLLALCDNENLVLKGLKENGKISDWEVLWTTDSKKATC